MSATSSIAATVVTSGFVIAFVFGAVANRTNSCPMGAVPDVVNLGDRGRARMWMPAVAIVAGCWATLKVRYWRLDRAASTLVDPKEVHAT